MSARLESNQRIESERFGRPPVGPPAPQMCRSIRLDAKFGQFVVRLGTSPEDVTTKDLDKSSLFNVMIHRLLRRSQRILGPSARQTKRNSNQTSMPSETKSDVQAKTANRTDKMMTSFAPLQCMTLHRSSRSSPLPVAGYRRPRRLKIRNLGKHPFERKT